mmetsp:Transcript_35095/g.101060  ORF Transcript_35095/g.101060 Transcript_35095/m.101060 type:complete len:244 (-) Transcript_35095:769-1500(-)
MSAVLVLLRRHSGELQLHGWLLVAANEDIDPPRVGVEKTHHDRVRGIRRPISQHDVLGQGHHLRIVDNVGLDQHMIEREVPTARADRVEGAHTGQHTAFEAVFLLDVGSQHERPELDILSAAVEVVHLQELHRRVHADLRAHVDPVQCPCTLRHPNDVGARGVRNHGREGAIWDLNVVASTILHVLNEAAVGVLNQRLVKAHATPAPQLARAPTADEAVIERLCAQIEAGQGVCLVPRRVRKC